MKEVLRFPVNIPTEVALRFEEGKHVEGRYGEQVMYSLADDRVMYVPPVVEQRIEDLAIAIGEPFEITKQEMRNGTRKWIEWQVRRVVPPPAEHSAARRPIEPELVGEPGGQQDQQHGSVRETPHGGSRPNGHENACTNRHPRWQANAGTNGYSRWQANAETNGTPADSRLPANVPELITGIGMRAMEVALNGAAEIAQRIESGAAARNFSLRFSSEDIRAIGLTLFIQITRDGGARWQQ